jgi:hypothetical protein
MLVCIITAPTLLGQDQPRHDMFPKDTTSSQLREGTWTLQGPRHILPWVDPEHFVKFNKSNGQWLIFFVRTNPDNQSLQGHHNRKIESEGPYPVSITDGVMQIEKPEGTLKYSCRFHGDLLQFPALLRLDEKTFNFTFSEIWGTRSSENVKATIRSYTWVCESDPSKKPKGDATLTVALPDSEVTSHFTYRTEAEYSGPVLIFERKEDARRYKIGWSQNYDAGIYESDDAYLSISIQNTYAPADSSLKAFVDIELEKITKRDTCNVK